MKPKDNKLTSSSHKKVETQIDDTLNVISKQSQSFGPSLKFHNKPNINKGVKRIIHYDCKPHKPDTCESLNQSQDEVPNENEIYEKRTLLKKDLSQDQGDDISLININVSVLFSSENNSGVNNTNITNITHVTNKSHQSHHITDKSSVLEYSADSKSKPSLSGKSLNTPNTQNNSVSNNSAEHYQERAFVRERVNKIMKNKTKYLNATKDINTSQNNPNTSNTNTLDPEEIEELYDTVDINHLSSNLLNKEFKESQSSASKGFKSINRSKKSGTHQIFSFNKSCSALPTHSSNLKDNSQMTKDPQSLSTYLGYGRFNSISHKNEPKQSRAEPLLKNLNSLKLITNKTLTSKPLLKETKITKEEINVNSQNQDKDKDDKDKQSATSSSSTSLIESILKNYPGSIELINKDDKVINIINISNTYTIENVTINNYIDNKSKINLKNYVKSTTGASASNKQSSQTPGYGMKSESKKSVPQIINKYNKTSSKFSSTTNANSKKIDFINLSMQPQTYQSIKKS